MNNTVADFLIEHKKENPVSFHMPGHKGKPSLYERCGYGDFLRNSIGNDITEITGADALTQPRGVIRQVMDNYAELYGVRHTELLVNGSSAGLMAAILESVPRGGKLILGRNSHKSVFSALRLGGIQPLYVKPEITTDHLQGGITPKAVRQALIEHPDAAAVLITSPNYYGVLSDVEGIALEAHAAGKILIVDQAHGAHLKFFDETARNKREKHAAENLRADIVVNSTHKTLASFTGTAILNVCTDRIDVESLSEKVRMLQTTSPSYLLMGSLDINEKILRKEGPQLIQEWKTNLRNFYRQAEDMVGVRVIRHPDMDLSKINLSMSAYGLTGNQLAAELEERGIWPELVHGDYVMLMTGIGNTAGDYEALAKSISSISNQYGITKDAPAESDGMGSFDLIQREIPSERERIPLSEAAGRVVYDSITPYPPGVPFACPGEVLTEVAVHYLEDLVKAGITVLGITERQEIFVGPEEDD